MRKIHEILGAVRQIDGRLQNLERDSEVMKTVLIVKEPGTPLAANAFDGLRKQVLAASGERRSHLTQLVQFDTALRRGVSVDDAQVLVHDWLEQAGVQLIWKAPENLPLRDLFEVAPEAQDLSADALEITDPAYVDSSGALLRLGRARPRPGPPSPTHPDGPAVHKQFDHPRDAALPATEGIPPEERKSL